MYCSVGLHTLDTRRWEGETTGQKILAFAQSFPKVVAIGEMGLDFYKDEENMTYKKKSVGDN